MRMLGVTPAFEDTPQVTPFETRTGGGILGGIVDGLKDIIAAPPKQVDVTAVKTLSPVTVKERSKKNDILIVIGIMLVGFFILRKKKQI